MGIDLLTNFTKRAILQLYRHHQRRLPSSSSSNPGVWPKSLPTIYQHSSFSTSSTSDRKMGLLSWYLRMLDIRPVITKSISSAVIYAAADLTSQTITMPLGSFDLIRTLRMAGFGLLILGPAQHMWFNFAGRILPKRDTVTTLKKLMMGQLSYGPLMTAVFFIYNAALQGESTSEIAAKLERDLLPTIITGLMYWPVCDFFTFKIIPVHLQPLVNSSFSYLWTIYLTYMGSLKTVND